MDLNLFPPGTPKRSVVAPALLLAVTLFSGLTAWAVNDDPPVRNENNPLLEPGEKGACDQLKIGTRALLREGPEDWKMWYEAGAAANTASVGYATSKDGIHWTKHPSNPVMRPTQNWEKAGSGSAGEAAPSTVLKENGAYRMWYHGSRDGHRAIGYATSPDGLAWTPCESNPVLLPGKAGAWDADSIVDPKVVKVGDKYFMYYTHAVGRQGIGLALSDDGIKWTKWAEAPVLAAGAKGLWDEKQVGFGEVFFDGKIFHMWYLGGPPYGTRLYEKLGALGLGYAWSQDGKTWTRSPRNPVLSKPAKALGKGDDAGVNGALSVLLQGEEWWIYYGGARPGRAEETSLCLATVKAGAVTDSPPVPGTPARASPTAARTAKVPKVTQEQFMQVMRTKCARCHSRICKDFDKIMKQGGWIVPGDPEHSKVYTCIGVAKSKQGVAENGNYHDLSDADKAIVHDFIAQMTDPKSN